VGKASGHHHRRRRTGLRCRTAPGDESWPRRKRIRPRRKRIRPRRKRIRPRRRRPRPRRKRIRQFRGQNQARAVLRDARDGGDRCANKQQKKQPQQSPERRRRVVAQAGNGLHEGTHKGGPPLDVLSWTAPGSHAAENRDGGRRAAIRRTGGTVMGPGNSDLTRSRFSKLFREHTAPNRALRRASTCLASCPHYRYKYIYHYRYNIFRQLRQTQIILFTWVQRRK
jgi:hypothetical protein